MNEVDTCSHSADVIHS